MPLPLKQLACLILGFFYKILMQKSPFFSFCGKTAVCMHAVLHVNPTSVRRTWGLFTVKLFQIH